MTLYDQSCCNPALDNGKGLQDFENAVRTAKNADVEWLNLVESELIEFKPGAERDFLKCFGQYENKALVLGILYQTNSPSIFESSLTVSVKSALKQCSNCINRTLPEVECSA